MNILVTGAGGLIGTALVGSLSRDGHEVVRLRRGETDAPGPSWNPESGHVHLDPGFPLDAVIHLAGENIAQRWTTEAKARIRHSRVQGTQLISAALAQASTPPQILVCASATGFYGNRGEEILDERSPPGTGFLAELCQAWETASAPARERGIRVVHLRLGIVLARQGGALARILPLFRLGLGGRLGSGQQFWSWITLDDVLRVVELVMRDSTFSGAVNAVSPGAVTNAAFTAAIASALHRPALLPVPALLLRIAFGAMAREALLASCRVRPARLLEAGFNFHFTELDSAMHHLLAET